MIKDPEPDKNGVPGQVYNATAAALIAIPGPDASLPYFYIGHQVLARYPETTTFYRAKVIGANKKNYKLKFEDDADQIMEVERRFVYALGAPTPVSTQNAARMSNDNGIDSGNLFDAQFAAFQQQNPAFLHKATQVYHQNKNVDSQLHTPPVSGGASFGTSKGMGPPMSLQTLSQAPASRSWTPEILSPSSETTGVGQFDPLEGMSDPRETIATGTYVCEEPECETIRGFPYAGGLLRHQREVHGVTCRAHSALLLSE